MNRKTRKLVQIIAVVLAALMVGGVVASAVGAFAETAEHDRIEMDITYMEDEQALRVTQRLVYHNTKDFSLDCIQFYAAANMFRRESALVYEDDVAQDVFPYGYAPAGLDGLTVTANGETVHWGYVGTNEEAVAVYTEVPAGGVCELSLAYYVLLSRNRGFLGVDDLDVRLSGFYLIPGIPDDTYHDWQVNEPLQFTRWVYTGAADYEVRLTLPAHYTATGTGAVGNEDGVWRFSAEGVHEFACAFSKRWRETCTETDGIRVRVLANDRDGARVMRTAAAAAIAVCGEWFGALPIGTLDVVQVDHAAGALDFPGTVWVPTAIMNDAQAVRLAVYRGIVRQYIGWTAYPQPISDAWLSDTLCEYLALMLLERNEGEAAFSKALNATVLSAINQTVPGGLRVTTDARLFTASEYALVVLDRGCVVMHELRLAMGDERFLDGMRRSYELGREKDVLGEMDLVAALNEASGDDWEAFLTDWLFNVGDYVQQQVDWYE